MTFFRIIFWLSLFVVCYTYIGYGIVLYILVKIKSVFARKKNVLEKHSFEPPVTLIISAFNEQYFIERKMANTRELDYPNDKLNVIFITDGSTDSTPEIIGHCPEFTLLHQAERKGKLAAMNRAMRFVTTPLVIFSDANTLLNRTCIREMVKHYTDEKVGGVAGEKKISRTENDKAAGVGEGLYWKYESFLKRMDSSLYSVVGAAGELFSMRTSLYEDVGEKTIIEDFVQSLRICMKGYVVRYEAGAYATESSSLTTREEEKRKIRICAGGFQAMIRLKSLMNVFSHPLLTFQYFSHRVLRWTLSPLCLVLLLISNIWLWSQQAGTLYSFFMIAQALFYVAALCGRIFANRNLKVKGLYVPYYFVFMNISVFLGFRRFIRGKQSVLWERAIRTAE